MKDYYGTNQSADPDILEDIHRYGVLHCTDAAPTGKRPKIHIVQQWWPNPK